MKNLKLILHPFVLQLKQTFKIAHGSRATQPTLIVELQKEGYSGFGEASAIFYYNVTVQGMMEHLEKCRNLIENTPWNSPEEFWHITAPFLSNLPFLQCALDVACHDLHAKMSGKTLWEMWSVTHPQIPLTNYTLGIGTKEELLDQIQATPWPIYKIKKGDLSQLDDIQYIKHHTNAKLRVDVNGGSTKNEILNQQEVLQNLELEFLEQPLPQDAMHDQKALYSDTQLTFIADESVQKMEDLDKIAGVFHGINVKLMKFGGFTPALKMIAEARKLDLKILVGCMTSSTIAVGADAQLLPFADFADVDGATLVGNDPGEGMVLDHGSVCYSSNKGTGVNLKSED